MTLESDDNIVFKTGTGTNIKNRLEVDNNGATVKGNLNVDGTITVGGWKIEGGAENSLVFRRGDATGEDNQPFLRMAQDGNFWVSRSSARGWVPDNIKDLRDNKIQKGKNYYIRNDNWGILKSYGDKGVGVRDGDEGKWTAWRLE